MTDTQIASIARPAARCYAWPLTVVSGSDLRLHVSTKHPQFVVKLFRCGATIQSVPVADRVYEGLDVPLGPPDVAWGWPPYIVPIAEGLADGIYVAVPVPIGGGAPADEVPADERVLTRKDACLFVLARARSGRQGEQLLYKLPTATYTAYNQLGGVSLYAGAQWTQDWSGQGYVASLQRPGNGGVGGKVMEGDAPDAYARSSRRQVFAHWDYPLVTWLESQGYSPLYCTDFDLDEDESLLEGVSLLVSAGHDEYWSATMRRRVLEFVDRGGNVAFFTGDTACWEIEIAVSGDRLLCAKMAGGGLEGAARHPRGLWHANDPGTWLTLANAAWGGGWWDGRRAIEGYHSVVPEHWVFAGVEFPDEGVTGGPDTPIIGYETDGVALERPGGKVPRVRAPARGGAGDRVLLALAKLTSGWVAEYGLANAAMMLRTARSGGMVFMCGTTDWPHGLATDKHVRQITENVVANLGRPSLVIRGPIYPVDGEIGEGDVVGEGQVVEWYVDGSQVVARGLRKPDWTVTGGDVVRDDAVLSTRAGPGDGWLTVSVRGRDGDGVDYFGSRTVEIVSREQYLKRRIARTLHAMANPDEQGGALVDQKSSEAELASRVIPIRLQWVKRHAAILDDLMLSLEAMWEGNGRMADASLREDEK